jgi:hypothetical protein
MKKIIIAF